MERVRTISHYTPRGIFEDGHASRNLQITLDDFESQKRDLLFRLSSSSGGHKKRLVVISGGFDNPVAAMNSFADLLAIELKASNDLKFEGR
ncbi:MAG: hypothetical protein O3C63_06815 [Cyanobacteria bacterium]|nr:hypothetical protein [Cyanobacteriota bacterium]MDA1021657.1 hypothetical protein [Cyanobacteriota bacterium]